MWCKNKRQANSLYPREKKSRRKRQMLRRTTGEDEERDHAELPAEGWRMKERRGRDRAGAYWWSPPEIYEKSIYYSAAMNHGTACGGGGADQREREEEEEDMLHSFLRDIQSERFKKQRLGRVHVLELGCWFSLINSSHKKQATEPKFL